jgi:hypothetical protein
MIDIAQLIKDNQTRWQNMKPDPNLAATIGQVATRLTAAAAKSRYQTLSAKTRCPGA